jgi:hypothetical protein
VHQVLKPGSAQRRICTDTATLLWLCSPESWSRGALAVASKAGLRCCSTLSTRRPPDTIDMTNTHHRGPLPLTRQYTAATFLVFPRCDLTSMILSWWVPVSCCVWQSGFSRWPSAEHRRECAYEADVPRAHLSHGSNRAAVLPRGLRRGQSWSSSHCRALQAGLMCSMPLAATAAARSHGRDRGRSATPHAS